MYENIEIIHDKKLLLSEGPVWDELSSSLYFVDIDGKSYYKMNYSAGSFQKTSVLQSLGALALCDNGNLLLAMENGIYFTSPDGTIKPAHKPCKIKGTRFNDGKVGPDGCFYAGTVGSDFSGAFYRLNGDELEELFDSVGCSNGLDWTRDGKTMYYCDTSSSKLDRFDFDREKHSLSKRQKILDFPRTFGLGDGLTLDSDGNIWQAVWGGSCVVKIDPRIGKIIDEVKIPALNVSSCCFAGEGLSDLIITTAMSDSEKDTHGGKVFRYKTNVSGRTANRFKTSE